MKERIRKFLTTNPGWKALAFLLASLTWLMVYNTEDPNVTRYFTSNVTILNASSIEEMEKCYEILNNSNVINFSASAPRSIMDKMDERDFSVTADMEQIVFGEDQKTATVSIGISASSRFSNDVKINRKTRRLELSIEDLESKQFIVQAEHSGKVAEGYALGNTTTVNPNVLKVTGPASVIDQIDKVVAQIDVDGMYQDLIDNVVPQLFDANGSEITTQRLELSNTTVTISTRIFATKQVGLLYASSGKPAGDNIVIGVESNKNSVMVKGTSSILNRITSIEIPDTALDVHGATGDVTTTVDIREYLPEGLDLVDPQDARVTLTAHVEAYGTKNVILQTSSLKQTGLDSDLMVIYEDTSVAVSIAGTEANLKSINNTNVVGSMNLTGFRAGRYSVAVDLNLDPDKYSYTAPHVNLLIRNIGEEVSQNSADGRTADVINVSSTNEMLQQDW